MTQALKLQDKLLQKSSRKAILQTFIEKKSIGPMVVELDPTTACNLACHDCISANLLNQGGFVKGRLRELAEDFKKIGVKAVVLIGGGEPMAHPEFSSLVDYLSENNIQVGVTTNGTLMDRHMSSSLKTKWLRVSVDAGSPEVFQDVRPHASGKSFFNKVIDNMREFGKKKSGLLGYSFLILTKKDKDHNVISSNVGDITRAAKLAKEIGCDYFEVKPAFDIMHFLQKQQDEINNSVIKQIKEVKHLEDETFKIISPYTLNDALENSNIQVKDYSSCNVSKIRTVVSPSGVYVCPYHRGNGQMKIGDPTKQKLSEIWASERKEQVLDSLDPKTHCRFHCIRHNSNKLIDKIITGEEDRILEDFDLFI